MTDRELLEASLIALGDRYEGMAAELFDRFISSHPHYAPLFINPEAARERMTRETLEALVGLADDAWWVSTTITNFVDLHRNYAPFTAADYAAWLNLTITAMELRTGAEWPTGATAAWHRQGRALVRQVEALLAPTLAPNVTS